MARQSHFIEFRTIDKSSPQAIEKLQGNCSKEKSQPQATVETDGAFLSDFGNPETPPCSTSQLNREKFKLRMTAKQLNFFTPQSFQSIVIEAPEELNIEGSTIFEGDTLNILSRLPANSIRCVVTSPLYYNDFRT